MRAGAFFILLLSFFISFSQSEMVFEKTVHDFGEINEEDGPVDYTFKFLNSGKDTIKIYSVKASCGCTTPGWTREAVLPGDSGFVTVRYNTVNRPGNFRKSLRINSNLGPATFLYIKGNVIPRPRTIVELLPAKVGNLRFKYRSLNMGRINTEKAVVRKFDFYNDSDSTIFLDLAKSLSPEFISLGATKTELKPKEQAQLILTYDPVLRGDLGFLTDQITLETSDPDQPKKTFSVNVTITEYFPEMTDEELKEVPRLFISQPQYDFGDISSGTDKEATITLVNNGQSTLNIRKISSNCNCLEIMAYDEDIQPGKSTELKLMFRSKGRRGRQYKTLTIFSNDPIAPTQVLSVKAEVK